MEISIDSGDQLASVEAPFRLSAGPGAGKTHWLAGHVKQTLVSGQRLKGHAQVACITYTQIGADTLRSRLSAIEGRSAWISTIHSYLYHFVVRPYVHLLSFLPLETALLGGHDTLRPTVKQGQAWLESLGKNGNMWFAFPGLSGQLEKNIRWRTGIKGGWQLEFGDTGWNGIRGGRKAFLGHQQLFDHKKQFWQQGRIDHDDVICFASMLAEAQPRIYEVLSKRFPYIYLDEFQDTSAMQAELVNRFVKAGSTVGVIGDTNQTIFEFNDASPEHFNSFAPEGFQAIRIEGNRRSTAEIINVLNHLRSDGLVQKPVSTSGTVAGPKPQILVGELQDCIGAARKQSHPFILNLMARSLSALPALHGFDSEAEEPFAALCDAEREQFLAALCRGFRYFEDGKAREAIQQVSLLIRSGRTVPPLKQHSSELQVNRRTVGMFLLNELRRLLNVSPDPSVLETYRYLGNSLDGKPWGLSLSKAVNGKFATAANSIKLRDLLKTVRLDSAAGLVRTIHAFKGDEADAVFLRIDTIRLRQRLVTPANDEESRLLYVALSRARKNVFVSLPDLSDEDRAALESVGFGVQIVPASLPHPKSVPNDFEGDAIW